MHMDDNRTTCDTSTERIARLLVEYDVVLAPTYSQATALNRRQALSLPGGLFGSSVTTFSEWVTGLWEMHGDGRTQVSAPLRNALARHTLDLAPLQELEDTPGLSIALASVARQGMGVPAFERAVRQAKQGVRPHFLDESGTETELSAQETELLACVADYAEALEQLGHIEQGTMLAHLAARAQEVFPTPPRVCVLGDAPLTRLQESFFEQCGDAIVVDRLEPVAGTQPLGRVADGVDVRFAFPSGDYALPQVVLAAIDDARADSADARVVVTTTEPLGLYHRLEPALSARDVTCGVRARKPFSATDFGKLYGALRRVFSDEFPWDRAALNDVLHSSYLHLPKGVVWEWDRRLREDRLVRREDALAWLTGDGEADGRDDHVPRPVPGMRELRALGEDPWSLADVMALSRRYLTNDRLTRPYAYEQTTAIEAFDEACQAVRRCAGGESLETRLSMLDQTLDNLAISVSRANYDAGAGQVAQVRLCTQREASMFEAGSVHTLIACDLTPESYPVSDRLNAAQTMLGRFGARTNETSLMRERRTFANLLAVARGRVVLERPLNDANAEPTYPCAMLEEFVDAYRDPGTHDDRTDLDNIYQLPKPLQTHLYEAGEDLLLKDVRPEADDGMLGLEPVEERDVDCLSSETDLPEDGRVRVSPTEIDAYRDCPRSWFMQRRMNVGSPDEEAGPSEVGTFMHGLFQRFYLTFPEKVHGGRQGNLDAARETMFGPDGNGGVFAEWAGAQPSLCPGRRLPLAPGTSDMLMLTTLKEYAEEWLAFESEFLPGFSPVAFEYHLPPTPYAGGLVSGFIDRIDTDGDGNFVVVDYKGSLLDSYLPLRVNRSEIEGFNPAMHVQALLYGDLLLRQGRVLLPREPSGSIRALDREAISAPGAIGHAALANRFRLSPASDDPRFLELPVNSVVGAVYVSYKPGNKTSGALDGRVLTQDDVPHLVRPRASMLLPAGDYVYGRLMEFVEQEAADAIDGITRLDVEPSPIDDSACDFCPLVMCEMRRHAR
jgi:ATP-dependent helicase/nuclease subunit B